MSAPHQIISYDKNLHLQIYDSCLIRTMYNNTGLRNAKLTARRFALATEKSSAVTPCFEVYILSGYCNTKNSLGFQEKCI